MSRYGYDYSFAPGRQNGWRSVFRNVLMIGTIAAISAVSGGVVALDLLGPGSAMIDRPALVSPPARPVSVRVARAVTPPPSQPAASAPTNAGVEQPVAAVTAAATPAQATAQPSTTPLPQVAPAAPAASVEPPKTPQLQAYAQVPDSELTFTTGYARRRAMQTAATAGAGTKTDVARIEEQNQVGRGAKAKPKTTVAHQNGPQDQPEKLDFARQQQALALGDARDQRASRRPPAQQQGGFGGFFRGLF